MSAAALLDAPVREPLEAEAAPPPPAAPDPAVWDGGGGGDWPRTQRILPWLVAGFVTMLFLLPFDSAELPISLPVDAKLDRVVLAGIAVVWALVMIRGGAGAPRFRVGPFDVALIGFTLLALLSVVLNIDRLVVLEELALSIKKLALLLAYVTFFYIVTTVVRASEVRRFSVLIIGLAVVCALGTVWEYRTHGTNLFYDWAARLPLLEVKSPPALDAFERPDFVGPTRHGLALTAMLAMALPFALVRAMEPGRRRRVLYIVAACLILAGTTATLRKAALIVPGIAVITLLTVHRMELKRLLPLLAGAFVVTKVLAPGAMGQLFSLFTGSALTKSDSTLGRTADYAAVTPDISSHLVLGRGFGSYDPGVYRLLDNQYLNFLIELGVVGAMAYLGLLAVAMWLAFRATRRARPADRPAAEATLAAVAAFLVAGALFDAFAFPQVTYTFLLVMALGRVVAHADHSPSEQVRSGPEPAGEDRPLSELADAGRSGPDSRTAPRPAARRVPWPRRP